MVFIVVQWVNENSVSVVKEKKVVGENVELKEGSTVDVSAGISKGRIAIYKAEILKVCGTKAKALEFEASLVKKVAVAHGDVDGNKSSKRKRNPSQKVRENVLEQDNSEDREEAETSRNQGKGDNEKRKTNDKKAKGDNEDKENELERKKLQQSVQQERINGILQQRRTPTSTVVIPDETTDTSVQSKPQALPVTPNTIPNNPHKQSPSPSATVSTQSLSHDTPHATHTITSIPHTFTPSQPPSSIHKPSLIPNTPTSNPHIITPTQSIPPTYNPSTVTPTANRRPITPLNTQRTSPMQNTFTTSPFHIPPQPQTHYTNSSLSHHDHSSSYSSLLEDDLELQDFGMRHDQGPLPSSEVNSEWTSFTTHFTQQFEELKGEVEGLRSEVKHLKRIVRELKANPNYSSAPADRATSTGDPELTYLAMIKNTTKPLEGLKVLLYKMFTVDEVRVTASGGEGIALDRVKLDLIYCAMEKR
ncbi:myosin-M heavy chain-like [Montipora capricornis]|uniref:myosin-M heavy chain-like n=1 Tax=Montipora capricornis TaxID=246305 RepID=UPI0035F205D5